MSQKYAFILNAVEESTGHAAIQIVCDKSNSNTIKKILYNVSGGFGLPMSYRGNIKSGGIQLDSPVAFYLLLTDDRKGELITIAQEEKLIKELCDEISRAIGIKSVACIL